MIEKQFIAISSEIVNHKLVYLNSSVGFSLSDENGIKSSDAIQFLHNLSLKFKTNSRFICYSTKMENEYFFRHLPEKTKDELFQSHNIKKELDELKLIYEDLENEFFDLTNDVDETAAVIMYNQLQEINRFITNAGKITYDGYKINLANGKFLSINKNKNTFMLYDIFSYFRKPLSEVIFSYFGESSELLTENKSQDFEIRKTQNTVDCFYIVKLMNHVYKELAKRSIMLNRFHGASTITSAVFSKCKAKENFRNFKDGKFMSEQLNHAVSSGLYGARTEQLKLGYFEKINVYDLNSAYAEAALYLPQIKRHPLFSKRYRDDIFSIWFIQYDLPKNIKFGLLPNRDIGQTIRYKRRGAGWYYQPEIKFLIENYPDCFEIKHGFYVPYKTPSFVPAILDLYNIRKELKAETYEYNNGNNPLEKVVKLGLTTIYGKFLQRVGKAYYYNPLYGGFITSFVRAKLLDATKGKENKTICFLTDAIHTTAKLDLSIGDDLGQYRHSFYNSGIYLGAGVYELYSQDKTKKATRGFTRLDFIDAIKQLSENGTYMAQQDFFVGHNLNKLSPVNVGEYLRMSSKNIKISPLKSNVRFFDNKLMTDFATEQIDSELMDTFSGRESGIYRPSLRDNADIIFEGVEAGKYV